MEYEKENNRKGITFKLINIRLKSKRKREKLKIRHTLLIFDNGI